MTADRFVSLNRKAQQVDADYKPASHRGNPLRVVLTQIFNPSYQELKLHALPCCPGKHSLQKVLGGGEGDYLPEIT